MRLVVDAMGAEFGGIRTYVGRLLEHWHAAYPDDELHVVLPAGATLRTSGHRRHELRAGRPRAISRPLLQTRALRRLVREVEADAVLATMPATTLLSPGCPVVVVVHDLRHDLRPEQFSRARRLLRFAAYRRAYAIADGFVAVSNRTLDDLHRLYPGTRGRPVAVAHHGADHVASWESGRHDGPAVAFAHHTNKNPDLVLDGWAELAHLPGAVPALTIVGVPGAERARLADKISELDLGEYVSLAAFLPDAEFRSLVAETSLVVFPSDFEGFGLPIVEGMRLGAPVVIGPDAASIEVAGGHAVTMAGWTAADLASAVSVALRMTDADKQAAREWALTFTWDRCVRRTRKLVVEAAAPGRGHS